MIWLAGIVGVVIGMALGAAIYKQVASDSAKVKDLEDKLSALEKEHLSYQHQVHTHFDTSASLFQKLTSDYSELYRHLASSAQQLCPETVYSQLIQISNGKDILSDSNSAQQKLFDEKGGFTPPKDYADKTDPNRKGSLSEDYGLEKVTPKPSESDEVDTETKPKD